jgi:methylated-DNA-[protein]-cysteine S-methyltransferase
MKSYSYDTKIGKIIVEAEDNHIVKVSFSHTNAGNMEETPLIKNAYAQIAEYLNGQRKVFDLPLRFLGTKFQNTVWRALLKIPYGETRSYKEISKTIGEKQTYRAVGAACKQNPICIIIPCHRVIGTNGNLTGYAGGINIKETLLQIERENDTAESYV